MKVRVLKGVFMALIALIFAVFALFFSVWVYLELSKRPSRTDVVNLVAQHSDELKRSYAAAQKDIEMEWENMYQKMSRLVGRADKNRGLMEAPAAAAAVPEPSTQGTRSDLLRKHRANGGAIS